MHRMMDTVQAAPQWQDNHQEDEYPANKATCKCGTRS